MIQVDHVTLRYPNGKGIQEVSFRVREGQVMGYLGPNGAGKTTTIRCLLGFSRADSGSCSIGGMDCWRKAPEIQRLLGYLPGEIAFLDGMTGRQFLGFLSRMRDRRDGVRQRELEERFEIDLSGKIKRYSKGMKQKVGIIAAFMHDPQVIILDEPTSGLDPLMQNRFTDLVLSEKKRGKTILMSSHMFEEVEKTCDRVVIIREGRVVLEDSIHALGQNQRKSFYLRLAQPEQAARLAELGCEVASLPPDRFKIQIQQERLGDLLGLLAQLDVISFESKSQSLEEIFLHLYGGEGPHESDAV